MQRMNVKGIWSSDFTTVMMIPLQRKMNAVECSDHRTISLISHASKILLKILTNRIKAKARDFVGQNQFGFRKGCGTRDAIGVMRMICKRSLEFGNNVYTGWANRNATTLTPYNLNIFYPSVLPNIPD